MGLSLDDVPSNLAAATLFFVLTTDVSVSHIICIVKYACDVFFSLAALAIFTVYRFTFMILGSRWPLSGVTQLHQVFDKVVETCGFCQ